EDQHLVNPGSGKGRPNSPLYEDHQSFFVPDAQGNVRIVYASDGTGVASAFDYGAYGGRTCSLDTHAHEPCLLYPNFGYTGQYQDSESGMVFLRARYYDPASQQFLSRD